MFSFGKAVPPNINAKLRQTFTLIDDLVEFDDTQPIQPREQISPQDIRIAIQTLETALEQLKASTYQPDNQSILPITPSKKQFLTTAFVQYLFNFTIIWQILDVVVAGGSSRGGIGSLLVLQTFHLFGVLFMTLQMLRRVRVVSFSLAFLVQSYFSTLLLFGGIFFLIYKLDNTAFTNVAIEGTDGYAFYEYIRVLYFSATTMTTVGYGDISPHTWYACILVIIEQLVSFVFTTVLFGMGLVHFSGRMMR